MPSLRQKVTTYFRQLSFIAEPRESPKGVRKSGDDGNFITKYLERRVERHFLPGPEICSGQNPTDLPELKIGSYPTGPTTIIAACTGPDEGLTGIKRSKLHLSASYADDIDFIDTAQENDCFEVRGSIGSSHNRNHNKLNRFGGTPRKVSNGSITPTSDSNANKSSGMRSRKNSRTAIANLNQLQNNTTSGIISRDINKSASDTPTSTTLLDNKKPIEKANRSTTIVVSMVNTKLTSLNDDANDQNNKNLVLVPTKSFAHTKERDGTNIMNRSSPHNVEEDNNTPTERLMNEAVSNQTDVVNSKGIHNLVGDAVAGVFNWHLETDYAYGISVSLYENNMLTKESMGSPIADCYGIVVRGDAAAMALADGVNWGDGARLAARSAVHGCLDYLDRAIFGLVQECMATSTTEVFVSLLRSLWESHACILEVGGSLSTLTVAVVLPLADDDNGENAGKYVVCSCNVGDSLGYVYSKTYGVREFTQASHDITSMRDMRDALGALGPAEGNNPELRNLTLSMTTIEKGDIIFLTSDGISDNFDPVVGKFAEAWTPDLKPMSSSTSRTPHNLVTKQQNKSASSINTRIYHSKQSKEAELLTSHVNIASLPPRTKKASSPETVHTNIPENAHSRPKYMRSHTVIGPRGLSIGDTETRHSKFSYTKIPKSLSGLPLVTGPQRHALTLYRLEDLLSYGINGTFSPCTSARRLCHLLIDFARMITSARRKTLEQRELFYKIITGPDGIKREIELNRMQHRAARKRVVDSCAFTALPGKLDHATVVAYTAGRRSGSSDIKRINSSCDPTVASTSTAAALLHPKEFTQTTF